MTTPSETTDPVDGGNQWYFLVDDEEGRRQEGPVSREDLEAMIAEGRLSTDTLVWRDGMAEWEQIGAMAELQQPATPEEVPPAAGFEPAAAEPEPEPEPAAAEPELAAAETEFADAEPESAVLSEPEAPGGTTAADEASDQLVLREFDNHTVRFSKSRNVLLVAANDSHAEPLVLTKLDLLGFLTAMETSGRQGEPGAA